MHLGLGGGPGDARWGSSELSLGCCCGRFSALHPRSVSSFQSRALRRRKISAHSWCQKQHFLFPKVDCKSWTFIFVIFHLLVLLMRLVIIYAGSALTQGLRSFLFISLSLFIFFFKGGEGKTWLFQLKGDFSPVFCFHELTRGRSAGANERLRIRGPRHRLCSTWDLAAFQYLVPSVC